MAIDVTVLRVFTDENGDFGNPLGVVDSATVAPSDRQQIATELGYSETIFVTLPEPGARTAHAHIHTPTTELPFAGHPTVGAAWWLNNRGTPVRTLQVPAGIVQVDLSGDMTSVSARAEWAPDFDLRDPHCRGARGRRSGRLRRRRRALRVDVAGSGGRDDQVANVRAAARYS